MHFQIYTRNQHQIAELAENETTVNDVESVVDVMAEAAHAGADALIIHRNQLHPDFFDLKNGIAGDILQKFSNYRMRLAIIGDFSQETSKSLRDFIRESNRGRLVAFCGTVEEALGRY